MKGYDTDVGYRGYMPDINAYRLFATETEYREIYRELFGY